MLYLRRHTTSAPNHKAMTGFSFFVPDFTNLRRKMGTDTSSTIPSPESPRI
jgi:hypothetical protein